MTAGSYTMLLNSFEGFRYLRYLNMSNLPFKSVRDPKPEQHWCINLKQVSLTILPDVDAAGYWSVKAWQCLGQDPFVIDGAIRSITNMECWQLQLHLQQQIPWASVQLAINWEVGQLG